MNQRFEPSLPRPGIFVMRDGVICQREEAFTLSSTHADLVPGALEGLRSLARLDTPVVVLSCHVPGNAGVVAGGLNAVIRGAATQDTHRWLRSTLRSNGARVDGIRSYPVAERDGVQCERKALVRLLQRAARLYTLDLASSVLVGDSWTNAQAALELACQPVLVMTGHGREQITLPQLGSIRSRTWYVADLAAAALSIDAYLNRSQHTQTVA